MTDTALAEPDDDLVARALDPDDDDVTLVAASGQRPVDEPRAGDILIAREPGIKQNTSVVVAAPQTGVATVGPLLPLATAAILASRPRRTVRWKGKDGLTRRGHTIVRRRGRESVEAFAPENFDWTELDLPERDWESPAAPAIDPTRWSAILSPFATGRVSLRTGNAVRTLIDGPTTFTSMAADIGATRGEHDYVYLLGWDNFDDFVLSTNAAGSSTFRELYTAAARRGVEVAAMLWDQPWPTAADRSAREITARIRGLPGKAIMDDLTNGNTDASRRRLMAAALAGVNNPILLPIVISLIEPDLARLGGSHHQKLLVVKRGETLIGYCGGIDMNPNRVRVVDTGTGQPHHDTHCRIVGPSAHDLLATFLTRWGHHPESRRFGALRGASEPVPTPLRSPSPTDAPYGGTVSCAIARTFNPVPSRGHTPPPTVVRERSIKPMLLAAIASARSFIYCEDQYLIDLDTADALAAALPRLTHVTILIPGNAITDVPLGAEYRRDFVERVRARARAADLPKFGVFQLTSGGGALPIPQFGDHTYVHSKSWVFDDELAVIGTANCNRRSYTYDSEVNAFLFDDRRPSGRSFAQNYRMELWQHHLTVPGRTLMDGAASGALWRRGRRPLAARVTEFDHRRPSTSGWSRAAMEQELRNFAASNLRDLIDPVP